MATYDYLTPDPEGGNGFNRAHNVTSIKKMVTMFGTAGGGAAGDNSVRAYDAITNSWSYLKPNTDYRTTVQNRDNHISLYVHALGQIWITGGSHLETLPPEIRRVSGRFSIDTGEWINQDAGIDSINGAFVGVIKNPMFELAAAIDPACDWSAESNAGLIFGGSFNGNPTNRTFIIEPNPAGPEPYVMSEIPPATNWPAARDQGMNIMVAVGPDWYLFSGNSASVPTNDFWKFTKATRQWTRLANPPPFAQGYTQPCITYDSEYDEIVVWLYTQLFVYSIVQGIWRVELEGLPNTMNQVCTYLPNGKVHVFSGGNNGANGSGRYETIGVKLDTGPDPVPDPTVRAWIAKPIAANMPASSGGAKHLRIAECGDNGKFYFCGGDWSAPIENHPWMGLRSYDPATEAWAVEYPVLGIAGEIMPPGCDEVGWVWDSKRKVFWLLPGYMVVPGTPLGSNLPTPVGTVVQKILHFDPAIKKWIDPGVPPEPFPGQLPKNATYDAATDTIWRCGTDGRGLVWSALRCSENRWDQYQTVNATDGTYINNADLQFEYVTYLDGKVYAVDPIFYRLFEFDTESHQVTIKAPLPQPDPVRVSWLPSPPTLSDLTQVAADKKNKRVFYSFWTRVIDGTINHGDPRGIITLIIFDPATNTYEVDPMFQPEGMIVRGNAIAYGPRNDVTIVIGGLGNNGDSDPTLTHFFLYRYAKGGTVNTKTALTYPNKTVSGNVTVDHYKISLLDSGGTELQSHDVPVNTAEVIFTNVAVGNGYRVRGETISTDGAVLDESLGAPFNVEQQESNIVVVQVGDTIINA